MTFDQAMGKLKQILRKAREFGWSIRDIELPSADVYDKYYMLKKGERVKYLFFGSTDVDWACYFDRS